MLCIGSWEAGAQFDLYIETHRWARLLKQQTPFTVYCLPTKENKLRMKNE
jgi:hypothetical protein